MQKQLFFPRHLETSHLCACVDVIFDWDNTFASMMLSFDSADLGYSALIQLVKTKTADGFIPNCEHRDRFS